MSAFAASFFRIVSAGQGLQGAFSSTSVNGSGNWRLGHTWGAGLTMSYSRTHSAASALSTASSNGETLSAGLTLQRSLTERLSASFGYQRLHQNYSAIAAIAGDPDSDREYGSVTYQLSRPLGR
jgi:outer membrane protein assembly factor BamA